MPTPPAGTRTSDAAFACPICSGRNVMVTDSRPGRHNSVIRRRRHCLGCDHRFTTHEAVCDKHQLRAMMAPQALARLTPASLAAVEALIRALEVQEVTT